MKNKSRQGDSAEKYNSNSNYKRTNLSYRSMSDLSAFDPSGIQGGN